MSWTVERARVASLSRSRQPDDPDLISARRNMRAEHLAAYVERVVSEAPTLTDDQLRRISSILRPTLHPTTGGERIAT